MNTIENGKIIVINEKETRKVLDMPTAVADVERSLKEYAEGFCVNPVKLHLPARPIHEGYMNSMPAFLTKHNVMGAKMVSVYKYNIKKYGLPTTLGTVVLQHPETGMPFAVIEGTHITSIRTGAAAGVAAKHLAKSGTHVVLQVGAGVQGTMAARAILTGLPAVDELRIAEINPDNLERFIKTINEEFPKVKVIPYDDYKAAVPGASVCSFATTAPKPLSREVEFDKGTVVLLVSEFVDNKDLLRFDKRVVDFPECFCIRFNEELRSQAGRDTYEFNEIFPETFTATLGDVIAGKAKGRDSDDDTVIVGMVGMGCEDLMVALSAYERVMEQGLGTVLDFINC